MWILKMSLKLLLWRNRIATQNCLFFLCIAEMILFWSLLQLASEAFCFHAFPLSARVRRHKGVFRHCFASRQKPNQFCFYGAFESRCEIVILKYSCQCLHSSSLSLRHLDEVYLLLPPSLSCPT